MGAVVDSENGIAAGAFFREPAWHGLGTVFQGEVTDYREMLRIANMDNQNIRFADLSIAGISDWDGSKVALIGDDKVKGRPTVRGFASPNYEILQPEDIFAGIQFGPSEGMRWETAGQMYDGRQVFGTIAFERTVVLDPSGVSDETKMFLMCASSYDGSLSNVFGVTPVRVVCENTLNIALAGVKQSLKTKSTKNVRDRIADWQKAVANAYNYMDAFEKEAADLYAAEMSKQTLVEKVVPALFGAKPDDNVKGRMTKWEHNLENLMAIWNGPTTKGAGVAGTAWGAFNALTENNQYNRQVRKGNQDKFAMAGAGFDNATNAFRNKALAVVKSFA